MVPVVREIQSDDHERTVRHILPIFIPGLAEFWSQSIDFGFRGSEFTLYLLKSAVVTV
jgi:hypothetical protein